MTAITSCRACGNRTLDRVLTLGNQAYTGHFPLPHQVPPAGPLNAVYCTTCTLVQLADNFPLEQLYGDNYGYRSGLNQTMVNHLMQLGERGWNASAKKPFSVILDIGANDGTLLANPIFTKHQCIGMDPLMRKFIRFVPSHVKAVPDFFNREGFLTASDGRKADLVFMIAMAYDLPHPVETFGQVADCMADDAVLVIEAAYLPAKLKANAFDDFCHEHLEYYTLTSLQFILNAAGLYAFDVQQTTTNGGSFIVMVDKKPRAPLGEIAYDIPGSFNLLRTHMADIRRELHRVLGREKLTLGYGASTKGNVLLQAFDIGPALLPAIGEINPEKYGHVTPGTGIPIMSMSQARAMEPDAWLVLPWHFRDSIIKQEQTFLESGGELIFPLPMPGIVALQKNQRYIQLETQGAT